MPPKPRILTGRPAGVKDKPRVDFRPDDFSVLVENKGYRLAWSRAGMCPCVNNDQTIQPDPTCPLCIGRGYFYFVPDQAIADGATVDVEGNTVEVAQEQNAVIIQGIMSSLTQDSQIYERFGEWVFGTSRITTHPENKLSYRDRLIAVDSLMSYSDVIDYDGSLVVPIAGGFGKTGFRYPAIKVNHLRTLSTVFREGSDFQITADGEIEFVSAPPNTGDRLSMHYQVNPVWIVMNHLHTYRDTLVSRKSASTKIKDQFTPMPVQTVVKLDFLVNPSKKVK